MRKKKKTRSITWVNLRLVFLGKGEGKVPTIVVSKRVIFLKRKRLMVYMKMKCCPRVGCYLDGAGEFRPLFVLVLRSVLLRLTDVAPNRLAAPVTKSRMSPLYISASALCTSLWERKWVKRAEAWRVRDSISLDISRRAGSARRVSWSIRRKEGKWKKEI